MNRSNQRKHATTASASSSAQTENDPTNPSFSSLNWRRLLGYLKPYTGRMALALIALLVATGLGLAFPMVIVQLLDSVTKAATTAPLNRLAAMLIARPGVGDALVRNALWHASGIGGEALQSRLVELLAFRVAIGLVGLCDFKMVSPAGELHPVIAEGFRLLHHDIEGEVGPLAGKECDGSAHK